MSVKGMMQTVLVTELKQIQPDISDAALQYVLGLVDYMPSAEAQALKEQNAALVAQALKTAAKFILDANQPKTKRKAYAALADAVNKTPQQHLAEIRADAVLDFANHVFTGNDYLHMNLNAYANQYAEQIRKGEVKS